MDGKLISNFSHVKEEVVHHFCSLFEEPDSWEDKIMCDMLENTYHLVAKEDNEVLPHPIMEEEV